MINSEKQSISTASSKKRKKSKLNQNKEGSVRDIAGMLYVDFMLYSHRVREPAGLHATKKNALHVREQLDRIIMAIKDGTFEFRKVFPNSKKVLFFSDLERKLLKRTRQPDEVLIKDFIWTWYELLKASERVTERTLLGYKRQLELYILPFFGDMTFGDLTPFVLDEFTVWAKDQQYRKKPASNKTINKALIPLKMICKQAAIKFNWGTNFNPFFGFKKLPEKTGNYKIEPFSLEEQEDIIRCLPQHWKPYFQFAFCSGLRQGEQFALTVDDIDWRQSTVSITKAMTLNESGSRTMGSTKNQYSNRVIKMSAVMKKVIDEQVKISRRLQSKFLFCTTKGNQLNHANLCNRVWTPALQTANIPYRPMIQTRHSFATTALSLGENPLWIARTMGHRDTDMVIRVYTKYVSSASSHFDGNAVSETLMKALGNN